MLNALRSIVQEVNAAQDLDAILRIIVSRVKASMNTEVSSIYLRDKTNHFVLMATEGLNASATGKVSLALNEGLVGYVAVKEELINLDKAEKHPNFQYFPETGEEKFSAFLGVPIIHHRHVLGVLVVQQSKMRRFDEGEEAFLVTMSAQLAAVIAHAEATGALAQIGNKAPKQSQFQGVAGSPGVAIGRAAVVSPVADLKSVPYKRCKDVDEELSFFMDCLSAVRQDIKRLSDTLSDQLNKEEQLLFEAYGGMLDDAALGGEVVDRIKKGLAAQYAWSEVVLEHVKTFDAMDDAYLRERASDVQDLGRRVLAYLQESKIDEREYSDNTILIGEELSASVLAEIPREKLAGLVSLQGSSNSHVAILAKSMGIPTVMGAVDLPFTKLADRKIIVDGYNGIVISDPSGGQLRHYREVAEEDRLLIKQLETIKDLPCETLDNYRISMQVNTGLLTDASLSLDRGAEGVGLYRTEVPFMLRDRFPSEEEQRITYRAQLEAYSPHAVTMRTLDIGGDKSLPYFPIEEENPFLGWRGIRVTLDHPEIFLSQIRAMLKASEGLDNLRILLPMISSLTELEIAQMLIQRAFGELCEEGYQITMPPIGVMIEVPSAVYQVGELAANADFLSVGTNDLTQYLLAVDRNNPRVADLYRSLHPAVLRALDLIVNVTREYKKPVSICGELAGDPAAAVLLLAMGYDALSMSATNLLKVKSVIRQINFSDAKILLERVLQLPDVETIYAEIEQMFKQEGLERMIKRPKT